MRSIVLTCINFFFFGINLTVQIAHPNFWSGCGMAACATGITVGIFSILEERSKGN